MKAFLMLPATVLLLSSWSVVPPAPSTGAEPAPFALVELFTSQGCSSCPPADAQLQRLAERAEREGENIIALSFHVDYWNYLGWSDPYSQRAFSNRQYRYSGYLNASVYTPQMVVNGRTEFIGSRRAKAEAAVDDALTQRPELEIELDPSPQQNQVQLSYRLSDLPEGSILLAALTQAEAANSVAKGENRGRDLVHVNVVREFERLTSFEPKGVLSLPIPEDLTGAYAVIVYVQSDQDGTIYGAQRVKFRE